MVRRVAGLLLALGALTFAFTLNSLAASAVGPERPLGQSVKSSAKEPAVKKKPAAVKKKQAVRKKSTRKKAVAKRKAQPRSLAITVKPPNDAPDFDFSARIAQARELAAKAPTLPGDMVVDKAGNLSRFVWTLVVGRKTGPLTVVRMDEKGKNDKGLNITWRVNNFLNTRFQVADGYIVFAQRRPVRTPEGAKRGWEPAVYTAYAPELDTAKMRAHGMEYLRLQERRSYNHLLSHDVRSRVAPEDTVAETIPRSMVLRLMITEHIDPNRMKYVGIEQCIHEVLITVAANREKAYAYARSSAGALGIVQFIEPSYEMVRKHYPAAPLEPHFDTAMRDLRNAAMATVLHLDLQLAHLPADYLKRFTDSSYHLAAYLAAGYNRNTVKVVRTYRRTRTFTGGDAPYENKMYVRIQDWVGGYLKRTYEIS